MIEPREKPKLIRALGLYATTAIVIGSVVGSGIFSSPGPMARSLPSAPLLLSVWFFTGVLTLFGALTQCELVGQMPRTGGLYEYFREIYGEGIGFLYGWANFTIAGSGAIAAISYIFATYFEQFVPLFHLSPQLESTPFALPVLGNIFPFRDMGVKVVAAAMVVFLTSLNIRGVKLGGRLQSVSTSMKMLAMAGIVLIAFALGGTSGSTSNWSHATAIGHSLSGWTLIGAISLAMSGAFWAYDGWGNVAYVAGEVKDPVKTIPRAIIIGTFSFIALYMVVNLAYLYILPVEAVANAPEDRVATTMIGHIFSGGAANLIAMLILLSTFDTTNSSILTNARVYFAMAEHKLFYRPSARVHTRFQTPHIALMLQCAMALVLLFSGSFDLITDMYVFVNWMLYILMALGVFILRKRHPDRNSGFRVPGYPWVPMIFILFATAFVTIYLITDITAFRLGQQPLMKSLTGVALVLSGIPFYYYWRSKKNIDNQTTALVTDSPLHDELE